jgi:hypothetical protein
LSEYTFKFFEVWRKKIYAIRDKDTARNLSKLYLRAVCPNDHKTHKVLSGGFHAGVLGEEGNSFFFVL